MCVLFEIASKSFDFFWVCRVQCRRERKVQCQYIYSDIFVVYLSCLVALMTCMPPNASLHLTFSGVRVRLVLFCCGQICPKTPIIHQKLGFWPSFKKPKPMLDGNKLANLLGPYIMTHFVQNQFLKVGRSHYCFRTTAWFLVPCSSHDIINGKSATPRRF